MYSMKVSTPISYSPNFTSCTRVYKTIFCKYTRVPAVSTFTCLFRNDIGSDDPNGKGWLEFAKFLETNFADKNTVNSYCLGCSDGTEVYSYSIALKETLSQKEADKFFPIKAIDQDEEIIKTALQKRINLSYVDMERLKLITPYWEKYFYKPSTQVNINGDLCTKNSVSYSITPKMQSVVDFKQGDILSIIRNIEDSGNTVLLCRNLFPYMTDSYQKNVLNIVIRKLKQGSIIALGNFDKDTYFKKALDKLDCFKEVKRNVYRKMF
ncbi:MAG: hypothetical protein MJ231_00070 [bacterium]|nr:hypothetical protein [bacterium]